MNQPQMLEAKALSCIKKEQVLLSPKSFHLQAGELLQVIGPNGAGKSTLLKVLAGLMPSHTGGIYIDEKEIRPFSASWREQICFIGQDERFYPELTAKRYLDGFHRHFPSKSPKHLGEHDLLKISSLLDNTASTLSVGQQRRVVLSRLVLSSSPIWLLDEPYAALDGQAKTALNQIIEDHCVMGGMLVISSHRYMQTAIPGKQLEIEPSVCHI